MASFSCVRVTLKGEKRGQDRGRRRRERDAGKKAKLAKIPGAGGRVTVPELGGIKHVVERACGELPHLYPAPSLPAFIGGRGSHGVRQANTYQRSRQKKPSNSGACHLSVFCEGSGTHPISRPTRAVLVTALFRFQRFLATVYNSPRTLTLSFSKAFDGSSIHPRLVPFAYSVWLVVAGPRIPPWVLLQMVSVPIPSARGERVCDGRGRRAIICLDARTTGQDLRSSDGRTSFGEQFRGRSNALQNFRHLQTDPTRCTALPTRTPGATEDSTASVHILAPMTRQEVKLNYAAKPVQSDSVI
ncbi:hypothetical protein C8R45DRAFT_934481 [Mycena sanguinolenta]|nr:hypothetical protein C8R45DRAFT_934481 [Mycena sanguinolenta]